jgi:hypothetical protein
LDNRIKVRVNVLPNAFVRAAFVMQPQEVRRWHVNQPTAFVLPERHQATVVHRFNFGSCHKGYKVYRFRKKDKPQPVPGLIGLLR